MRLSHLAHSQPRCFNKGMANQEMKKAKNTSSKPQNKNKKKVLNLPKTDDKFKIVDVISSTRNVTHEDIDRVLNDRANRVAAYISTILEPELAVTDGTVAKLPTTFPIPSTTVSFRNNVNISTDASGDFALAWNPNLFSNVDGLTQYKYNANLTSQADCDTLSHLVVLDPRGDEHLLAVPSYVPDVALSKYRLVSAKLKVTYIGSVLQKSGMMYACATYDQTPVVVGVSGDFGDLMTFNAPTGAPINWTSAEYANTVIGRTHASMNEQAISNGIWNKSLNITNSSQGMSCLHIPTDPINEIFYPIATYFGNKVDSYNVNVNLPLHAVAIPQSFESLSGAQLCYLMCGHGLPPNTECINIQVYYNYEVIPTQSTAPFLRPALDIFSRAERELVREVVTEVAPLAATSTKLAHRGIWSTLKDMLKKVDWAHAAEAAVKLVPQVLKMF